MPLIRGVSKTLGPYYKWGKTGHRYYYEANHEESRKRAKTKALLQGKAVEAHKHANK